CRVASCTSNHARLGKRGRIQHDRVTIGAEMQVGSRILSWNDICQAIRSRAHGRRTGEVNRLTALECSAPDEIPAAGRAVRTSAAGHIPLTFSKRKLVASAEVDDITNVEICYAVIAMN